MRLFSTTSNQNLQQRFLKYTDMMKRTLRQMIWQTRHCPFVVKRNEESNTVTFTLWDWKQTKGMIHCGVFRVSHSAVPAKKNYGRCGGTFSPLLYGRRILRYQFCHFMISHDTNVLNFTGVPKKLSTIFP